MGKRLPPGPPKKEVQKMRAKRGVDSPTCKLTPKILKDLCDIVRKGTFRYVACQQLGITVVQYGNWMKVGRQQIADFAAGKIPAIAIQGEMVIELDKAEGFVHGKIVQNILESNSIPAMQWYLEKRFNKLYTSNPNVIKDDESGEDVHIDGAAILAERLATLLKGRSTG